METEEERNERMKREHEQQVAMLDEAERTEPLLQYFKHAHLPPHLAAVSAPFADLAHTLVRKLPRSAERTVAVRKLLESKDCAVRALLPFDRAACIVSKE